MKKFLLVLGILMFAACSANAYSMPRWSAFPLTIYMPDSQYAPIVKSAFESWKSRSNGLARFIFKKSHIASTSSNINIVFYDKLPDGKAYKLTEYYAARATYPSKAQNGYFLHTNINIALKDASGKPYSRQQLKAISLQAIGRAMGIPCQGGDVGVMVCDEKYNVYDVTKEDYQALVRVYNRVN